MVGTSQMRIKARAMSLCGATFTVNWTALRHWKQQIMSCSRINEHGAIIPSETHNEYIYLINSQPLEILNCIKPFHDFGFILINCATLLTI